MHMTTLTAAGTQGHLFWIASRAAGTAALVLSSVAVAVGLSMGSRLVKGRLSEARAIHEALSLATLLALVRSEEHTSELQSHVNIVCRLLLEKKKKKNKSE